MNRTIRRLTAALCTTATAAAATLASLACLSCLALARLPAQNVLLHEVQPAGHWIELHNRSVNAVDLSTWSLHYVSRTPGMPRTYWWGFPAGTTLAPGAFVRVHWYQPVPASPAANELFTGDTPWHFLFGLGGEALSGSRGALALLRSQQSAMMNSASIIEDWVSWGEHDFPREQLAVQAGLWSAGRHTPSISANWSLARETGDVGLVAFHDEAWFLDNTPTPLQPNVTGASVLSYGAACALPGHHLLGLPHLSTTSLPLIGSTSFGLAIDATTGIYGECALLIFSAAMVPITTPSFLPPAPVGGCHESVDPTQLLALWLLPTQIVSTQVPMSLAGVPPALVGLQLHAQAVVIDLLPYGYLPYQGITNALRLTLGQ
ncbi:MAG TPA: lamin tail domain-containing protein [Planctomycetota bacterium]